MVSSKKIRAANRIFSLILFLTATPLLTIAQKPKPTSAPFVDYCSLYLEKNLNKTFSSRALMFYLTVVRVDGGDGFLYSPDCNRGDYFAVFGEGSKGWERWDSFFRDLEKEEKHYVLEIEFEGKMGLANHYLFGHLGWARAELTTSRITSIKNVTGTSRGIRHQYNTPSPLTDQIKQRQAYSFEFLRSIFTLTEPKQFEFLMLPTFVFVDGRGRSLTKPEYLAREKQDYLELRTASTISTDRDFVKQIGNTLTELGTIEIKYEDGSKRSYRCEMVFQLVNDEWKLSRAEMK